MTKRPGILFTRQRILILALAVVGVLAWWLYRDKETPGPKQDGRERRPDYTVNGFSVTTMDEFGMPNRHLTAGELRHYPDDDSKELEAPILTLYVKTGPPWLVRSERAWISSDNNLIRLQGEVYIDRESGVATRPVHLETREVLLKRDVENYAETDQPVRITSENDWTTAENGARVRLGKDLRVTLLGRVRSEIFVSGLTEKMR